jgi:hypothetical protein
VVTPHATGAYVSDSTLGRIAADGVRRHRQNQVLVRLSDAEAADAQRLAAAHGLTLPALLRAGLTNLIVAEATHD